MLSKLEEAKEIVAAHQGWDSWKQLVLVGVTESDVDGVAAHYVRPLKEMMAEFIDDVDNGRIEDLSIARDRMEQLLQQYID